MNQGRNQSRKISIKNISCDIHHDAWRIVFRFNFDNIQVWIREMDLVKCRNRWTCCVTLGGSVRGKDVFERSKLNKKTQSIHHCCVSTECISPYWCEYNNRFIIVSNYFVHEFLTVFCRLLKGLFSRLLTNFLSGLNIKLI